MDMLSNTPAAPEAPDDADALAGRALPTGPILRPLGAEFDLEVAPDVWVRAQVWAHEPVDRILGRVRLVGEQAGALAEEIRVLHRLQDLPAHRATKPAARRETKPARHPAETKPALPPPAPEESPDAGA
jgi:hypothetical protein